MLAGNEYYNYFNSQRFGYTHQYVRNVLQLNRGMSPDGHPVFSEVGFMADIYETDWSWDPLVADFDNDGFRDLVVTNGLPRDVTDLDYVAYNNGQGGYGHYNLKMVDSLPIVRLPGYSFKNNGGFTFTNTSADWGFTHPSFSNGGAYVDLDNDGDLDLVINNINEPAFVYENTLNTPGRPVKSHWLSASFAGEGQNLDGIGASLRVYYNHGEQQFYEHQPCRGYMSTDDYRAHFGLGAVTHIDSVRVRWPDGRTQLLKDVPVDQHLTVSYRDAAGYIAPYDYHASAPLFDNVAGTYGIHFKPQEKDVIDYNIQPAIPHKLSQYGPGIAVGDVDKNGYEDFWGFFAPSNIRLGFNYVPLSKLMVGASITKANMTWEGYAKYAILQQTPGKYPVSITYYGDIAVDSRSADNFITSSDRLMYFNQIIIARKINSWFSLQVSPGYTHVNRVDGYFYEPGKYKGQMKHDHFSISTAGRFKIKESMAVIFNYDQPLTKHPTNNPYPNLALGLELATSAHSFQFFAGNYNYITPSRNNYYNQNDYSKGEFLIGFNITRLWNY